MKLDLNTELTQRDKKLLVALSCIVIVVGFVFLGIRPLYLNYDLTKQQLDEEIIKQSENENKVAMLNSVTATTQELKKKLNDITKDYYSMLQSDEIDKLLTELIVNYGLSARDLTITMPTEELALAPYEYSEAAKIEVQNDNEDNKETSDTQDGSEDTVKADITGLYAAEVTVKVKGDTSIMKHLIDTLSLNYPSIRITGYSWGKTTDTYVQPTGDTFIEQSDELDMSLEIYMYKKDGE